MEPQSKYLRLRESSIKIKFREFPLLIEKRKIKIESLNKCEVSPQVGARGLYCHRPARVLT